ncbi:MAG: glycosyltransferase family 2 protein [Egibacteraceae bacterium]
MHAEREALVSVVVPVHARANELDRLLLSLCHQDFDMDGLEVVVVENKEQLNRIWLARRTWPFRLRCAFVPYGNQAACRNVGAWSSSGRWLVFLDSDVLLAIDTLRRLLTAAESIERAIGLADVVHPPCSDLTLATQLYDVPSYFREYRRYIAAEPLTFKQFVSCAFVMGRADFEAVGGFDGSFSHYGYEDVEFALRAERAGLHFHLVSKATAFHHKRLTPTTVLSRSIELGHSAVHFVWLHSDIEDVMPLGVRDTQAGVLSYRDDFDPAQLLRRAEEIEMALSSLRSEKLAAPLGREGTRLYNEISLYGRYTGIQDELARSLPLRSRTSQDSL